MNPQIMLLAAELPAGRLFGLDQQMFISVAIQLFNTCVLAAALAFILYNPVRNFLKKRSDGIKAQMDRAEDDMAKANDLKTQYEQKLKDIELEREEILNAARELAIEKSKQFLAAAKTEAEALKERATADIAMERARVNDEMKHAIIEVSSAMAEKFVARTIDKETQDKLFTETIVELEEIAWHSEGSSDRQFAETVV